MKNSSDDVLWTIKVSRNLDEAVQKTMELLGYKSKAELTREAIREFLIHRKLYNLIGGEPEIPIHPKISPEDAAEELKKRLLKIPKEILEQEIKIARDEVANELLNNGE